MHDGSIYKNELDVYDVVIDPICTTTTTTGLNTTNLYSNPGKFISVNGTSTSNASYGTTTSANYYAQTMQNMKAIAMKMEQIVFAVPASASARAGRPEPFSGLKSFLVADKRIAYVWPESTRVR